jgi:hypothetical protein
MPLEQEGEGDTPPVTNPVEPRPLVDWSLASRDRTLAAFHAGRLLARLRFHAVQAWLTTDNRHRRLARASSRDLGRLARVFEDTAAAKSAIQKGVTGPVEKLMRRTRELDHHECLDHLVKLLNDPYAEDDDVPDYPNPDAERVKLCRDHASPVSRLVNGIRGKLRSVFADREVLALELGEAVEHGVRHERIHRQMISYKYKRKSVTVDHGPGAFQRVVTAAHYYLTTRRAGEIAPRAGWPGQVAQLALELNIPEVVLRHDLHGPTPDSEEGRLALVERVVDSITAALSGRPGVGGQENQSRTSSEEARHESDQAPERSDVPSSRAETSSSSGVGAGAQCEGLQPRSDQTRVNEPTAGGEQEGDGAAGRSTIPPQEPGYLGLIVVESTRRVSRLGKGGHVDLADCNQAWHLFGELYKKGEGFWHYDVIDSYWERFGNTDRPERGTVRAAMSDLNKRLAPLGVAARASRKVGYRLLERGSRSSGTRRRART